MRWFFTVLLAAIGLRVAALAREGAERAAGFQSIALQVPTAWLTIGHFQFDGRWANW